jgi:hypothetical protein
LPFCVKRKYFKRFCHLLPPFSGRQPPGAFYALRFPMCPQKLSPHAKIRDPTDLVNKFVLLARVLVVVPHHPSFCLVVLVNPGKSHRNRKSHCVCISRAHEQSCSNPASISSSGVSLCSRAHKRFG